MFNAIYVDYTIRPTRVLNNYTGPNLEVSHYYWLFTEFIMNILLDRLVSFSCAPKFAAFHLSQNFINTLLMLFNNHVSIGAQIMHDLKLLISRIVRHVRRYTFNILLVLKHKQLKFVCTHACVFDGLLILIWVDRVLTFITQILLHINHYAGWICIKTSTLRVNCLWASIISPVVSKFGFILGVYVILYLKIATRRYIVCDHRLPSIVWHLHAPLMHVIDIFHRLSLLKKIPMTISIDQLLSVLFICAQRVSLYLIWYGL